MKKTTKFPEKVKEIMNRTYQRSPIPFQSVVSNFNPKTGLYEVSMR